MWRDVALIWVFTLRLACHHVSYRCQPSFSGRWRAREGEGEVDCFFLLPLFYWQGEPIVLIEEVWRYMAEVRSCLHLTRTPSARIMLLHDALTLQNALGLDEDAPTKFTHSNNVGASSNPPLCASFTLWQWTETRNGG